MTFKVCRICGSNTELKSILDKGPEMIKKLLNYANVQVFREDLLPNFICQQCDQHLDLSVNLRKLSDKTARRLRKELKTKNQPAVVEEPATSSISCKKDINLNLHYTSVPSSTQMAIECSIESSSNNACKKENKPIHVQIKIESCDIDEEEFQMIDNSNLVLENESNYYEVYGSLESRPTSITEAQNDIKIEEVKLIPTDQISMDGNDAAESQNYLQMQQNDTNNMFIESEIKAYLISNHDINARKSPSVSTSFVGNGSMGISPLSDFATGDSEDLNLNVRSKSLDNLIEIAHPISNKTKKCTCNVCKEKFTHLDDLKRHMELHSDKYSYTCTTCFHSFEKRAYLDSHVKRHHPESNIHKQCSTTQPSTHGVKTPKENQSDHCGNQLQTPLKYQKYMQSIHPNVKSPLKCKTCNKEYNTLKSLTWHERLTHFDNARPHKCDFCFKSFQYKSQLIRHKVVHSDLPPQHSCSLCPAKFRRKDNLDTHMRDHSKEETFKCGISSEEFVHPDSIKINTKKTYSYKTAAFVNINALENNESELDDFLLSANRHISNKDGVKLAKDNQDSEVVKLTGDDPKICSAKEISWDSQKNTHKINQCAYCGKKFKTLTTYKNHLLYHTKNKLQWIPGVNIPEENQCDYCGKQLSKPFTYHMHIRNIHPHVEPPHKCKTCNKKFYTLRSQTRHERLQHSGNEGHHKCDICFKRFIHFPNLRRHKLLHSKLPPQHSCSICTAKFQNKHYLKVHMRIHSKGKPYKCGICSEKFLYSYLLKRHNKKNHSGATAPSGNINPLEKNEPKLLHKDDRLEDSAASSNWHISNKDTVKFDEDDCIDFSEESQQLLPSTSKTQIGNTECSKIAQNIVHENFKTISFSLPLDAASNSSTPTTESNFIELIKVEEYQTIEQNVELKTYKAKISSIYNIEDFI